MPAINFATPEERETLRLTSLTDRGLHKPFCSHALRAIEFETLMRRIEVLEDENKALWRWTHEADKKAYEEYKWMIDVANGIVDKPCPG